MGSTPNPTPLAGTQPAAVVSVPLVLSPSTPWSKSLLALGVSAGLHGVLVLALVVGVVPKARAEADTVDAWVGDTFEVSMAGPAAPTAAPPAEAAAPLEADPAAAQPATLATEADADADAVPRAKPVPQKKSARQIRRERRRAQARRARAAEARAKPAASQASDAEPKTRSESDGAERAERSEESRESAESGDGPGTQPANSSAGALGAAGLPPGLRQLPVAFTRVLPRAAVGDQRLTKQKLGTVGEIRFTLVLDATGRIVRADYAAGASVLLQDLVERTLRFLGKGQFALAPEPTSEDLAGRQPVVVRLSLSQVAASEGDPVATRALGFEPPRGKPGGPRVGRGYFELESGLRLDAEVEFE